MKKDIEYLEEKFPKGDKRRGEAMVLMALARIEGEKEGLKCSSISQRRRRNE